MLSVLFLAQLLPLLVLGYSPTGDYAPGLVSCPLENLLREANGLSPQEQDWLKKRDPITQTNLKNFLQNTAQLESSEYESLLSNGTIRVGLAFSGGGYRAMLAGAGQLAALDNTTEGAAQHGLGGLLESTTYLAGLSGGNWLVGTLVWNNWTSVEKIANDPEIWNLTYPLNAMGGSSTTAFAALQQWVKSALQKKKAGFDISFIDIWGRALSNVFFRNNTGYGEGITYSTLQDVDVFKNAEMPFPISVADLILNGYGLNEDNSTVIEANPFELGSWDPTANAFTQIKYLGSQVNNGKPSNGSCVAGFDNSGFMMGTSSAILNEFADTGGAQASTVDQFTTIANTFLNQSANNETFLAIYGPNPFYNSQYSKSDDVKSKTRLDLVDGGEDGQVIPFAPVIEKKREVDVVFAFDNGYNTVDGWPNGNAVVATYDRQFTDIGVNSAFPYVPDEATFLSKNFTHRPVFFGCDASNLTDLHYTPPLVVYLANTKYSFNSNVPTLQLNYSTEDKLAMIKNGFETSTRNNLTDDSQWAKCVGCAIIRRSQERAGQTQSDDCKKCFLNYCWDGSRSASNSSSASSGSSGSSSSGSPSPSTASSASGSSSTGSAKNAAVKQSSVNMFSVGLLLSAFVLTNF